MTFRSKSAMTSSGPVFTRQTPFQPASKVIKAYYHPSCNQSLSKRKKTKLSTVPSKQSSGPQLQAQQLFASTDGHPVFTESWPSAERASSPAASSDMETPKQSGRAGKTTVAAELGVEQDSVLAKYIDRFRHGQPQSREERQQMPAAPGEKQPPFWWMSPSSLPRCSTPTKTVDKDFIQPLKDDSGSVVLSPAGQRQRDGSLSPCRGSFSILSDTSQGEFEDTEIRYLQEKADRLLLRGECTLGEGSVPVSSEGLGCSDISSPVSIDEPVRAPLIPILIRSTAKTSPDFIQAVSSQKSTIISSLVAPPRREEDILFQWRLRRKMEQARERPQSLQSSSPHGPTCSWQTPTLIHSSTSGQAYKEHQSSEPQTPHLQITAPQPQTKEVHRSCPPASDPSPFPASQVSGSAASQSQAFAHVPAHMHLLCDVLPCPIRSSHVSTQQHFSESTDESLVKGPGNSRNTFTREAIQKHMPSPPHVPSAPPASSGAIKREALIHQKKPERTKKDKIHPRETEKHDKKTAPSFRKQKTSTRSTLDRESADHLSPTNRHSSDQRVPKKAMSWAEQQHQEGSQGLSTESCGDRVPPASPIHCALGQAVSKVLFPTVDSSPEQRTPVSSVCPPCTAPAPLQSSDPPCNAQNSMEVISQLLQEAEDSDEKEFEDDPLLQVLRKQRKLVKKQISEVDTMLNEFPVEQQ